MDRNNTCQACQYDVRPGQKAIVIQYGIMSVTGYVDGVTMRDVFHFDCQVAITQPDADAESPEDRKPLPGQIEIGFLPDDRD